MKRTITILLAIAYLVVSSGIVVDIHYCMGKQFAVSFQKQEAKKCGKCGMGNTGCCHDDVKVVKLQDSHQQVDNSIHFFAPEALFAQHHSGVDKQMIAMDPVLSFNNHSPPGTSSPSLFVLNCVFRI